MDNEEVRIETPTEISNDVQDTEKADSVQQSVQDTEKADSFQQSVQDTDTLTNEEKDFEDTKNMLSSLKTFDIPMFSNIRELEAYILMNDRMFKDKQEDFKDKRMLSLLPKIDEKSTCFYIRSQENINFSIFSILCAVKPNTIKNGNNFFFHNNNILYVVFDNISSFPVIINRIVKNDLMMLHSKYNYIKFYIDKEMMAYIEKNSCEYQISVVKTDQTKYTIKYDIQYINNNNSVALSSSEQEVIVNKEISIRMGRNIDLSKDFNRDKAQEAYTSMFNIRDLETLHIMFAFKIKSPELLTKNIGDYKISTSNDAFHYEFKGSNTRSKVINTSVFGKKVDSLIWTDMCFSGVIKVKNKIPSRDGFKQFKEVLFTVCKDMSIDKYYVLILLTQRAITEPNNTIDRLLSNTKNSDTEVDTSENDTKDKNTKEATVRSKPRGKHNKLDLGVSSDKNQISNAIFLLFGIDNVEIN